MPKRKVTPQQIVTALHRIELALAQGAPARAAVRDAGISSAAYYRWRDEYGGMNAAQVHRLLELKKENARLQVLVDRLSRVTIWQSHSTLPLMGNEGGHASAARPRVRRRSRSKSSTKP